MLKTFLILKPVKVNKTYLLGCDDIAIWSMFNDKPSTIIGYTEVYVVPKETTIPSRLYDIPNSYMNYRVTSTTLYTRNFHSYNTTYGVEFNLNLATINFNTHKVWVLFRGAPSHYDGAAFIPEIDTQIYEFTDSDTIASTLYKTGDVEITTAGYIPLHLGGSYWSTELIFNSDDEQPTAIGLNTCSILVDGTIGSKNLADYSYDDSQSWYAICSYREENNGQVTVELRIPFEDTNPTTIYGSPRTDSTEQLEYTTNVTNTLDSDQLINTSDYYLVTINTEYYYSVNNGKVPAMVADSRGHIHG